MRIVIMLIIIDAKRGALATLLTRFVLTLQLEWVKIREWVKIMILEIFLLIHAMRSEETEVNEGNWTEWSQWSTCSMRGKTCGYGSSTRSRKCKAGKYCGEEIANESNACIIATCAGKIIIL